MPEEKKPETIQDRKVHFEKQERKEEKRLRTEIYHKNIKDDKKETDQLQRKQDVETNTQAVNTPTPYGTQTKEKTFERGREASAMEKVETKRKQDLITAPLNRQIQYEVAKKFLSQKEKEYASYTNPHDREAYARAVNLQRDRERVTLKGQPKDQDTIRVTINHHDHDWEYERRGDQESFTARDDKGVPLIVIEKLDMNRGFQEQDNAVLQDNAENLQEQLASSQLDKIMEKASPVLDKKKREANKRRAELQDKAKRDFNQIIPPNNGGGGQSPNNGGLPPTPPNTPDQGNTDKKKKKTYAQLEKDLGKDRSKAPQKQQSKTETKSRETSQSRPSPQRAGKYSKMAASRSQPKSQDVSPAPSKSEGRSQNRKRD